MIEKFKCCEECTGDADTCEHAKYCMCGSRMEDHDIGSGHSPVSMHDYYARIIKEENTGRWEKKDVE